MKFGITNKITFLAAILVLGTGLIVGLLSYYGLRGELALERQWVADSHASAVPSQAIALQADETFDTRLAMARRRIVIGTLVFLLAAVVLAIFLASLLVRPLAAIAAAARDVADGRENQPLPTDRRDEIGSLARSFAAMAERIRQRNQEIKASQKRVQDILESAPDAMITMSRDGKILMANSRARALFGYSAEALVGCPVETLLPERFRSQHAQLVSTFLAGSAVPRPMGKGLELFGRRQDGSEFPAEISLSPFESPDGTITVSAIRDITQRKRQEHELITAREAALNASRAKSEFLAKMSHEIRTPLNAIIGMTELLQRTPLNGAQQKYARLLQAAGDNLLGVINDILDISRIESGQLTLRHVAFEPVVVLEGLIDMMAISAQARGLELVLDLPEALPPRLLGDPERLTQVLVNLVGNAIKFTDSGDVVLHVSQDNQARDMWRFTVRDTGIGIDTADQARIFESFTQADASITRTRPGTGLGLSISRQLVTMMGGRLWVESRKGAGSSFHVALQLERAPDGEATSFDARDSWSDLTGRRMLVVDDNASSRAVLEALLQARGATCTSLAGGVPVVDALREAIAVGRPYDVLVVDERMPDPDGFSVVAAVRAQIAAPLPRFCLLVADIRGGAIERLATEADVGHVVKPVKRLELMEAIRQLLSNEGPREGVVPGQSQAPAGDVPPLEVLLADDSPDNQEIVRGYIEDLPSRITVAADGREAVELFQRGVFDLVLMDIQMPVLDGYSAIREIREWEAIRGVPPTPIVALTAYALAEERDRSLAAGSNAHLSKPVRRAELVTLIRQLIAAPPDEPSDPQSDAIIRRRLPQYLERRHAEVSRLRAALAAGDFETIRTIGHQLKGHAGSYGLNALGELGRALESAAAQSDETVLAQLIETLEMSVKKHV